MNQNVFRIIRVIIIALAVFCFLEAKNNNSVLYLVIGIVIVLIGVFLKNKKKNDSK